MRRSALIAAALAAASIVALPSAALAETLHVQLTSYEEVPALSTTAGGEFRAFIDDAAGTIRYQLSYSGLTGDVAMAHIHFGQLSVNGGISVWLCQTADFVDPTGLAPPCVQSGTVTGLLTQANVVGPAGQGIPPTQFAEVVAAIRAGVAYVNVHSDVFRGGEIRGQF
jgi:CHRD domain